MSKLQNILFVALVAIFVISCGKNHNDDIQLYRIQVDDKVGFVDTAGHIRINAIYDYAENFSHGLALVRIDSARQSFYGFIDTAGQTVIMPVFDNANSFKEGLAVVSIDNKFGYIDVNGQYVIPAEYSLAEDFHNGTAWVAIDTASRKDHSSYLWGIIDKEGKYLVQPQFEGYSDISSTKSWVYKTDHWFLFDRKTLRIHPSPKVEFDILEVED